MTRPKLQGVPDVAQVGVLDLPELGQVPIVDMPRFDERQCCGRVLAYLAGELQGVPDDYTGCPGYSKGKCKMQGGGAGCAFHEPDSAPVWRKAAGWRLMEDPDGTRFVTTVYSAPIMASKGAHYVGALAEVLP